MKDTAQEQDSEQVPFEMIPHWLMDVASSREIHLYLILRNYAGRKDACWPARETLANDMGVSVKTIQRLIKGLELHGALEIQPRYTQSGGQTSNHYFLRWSDPLGDLPPEVVHDPDVGDNDDSPPGTPTAHKDIPIRTKKTKTIDQAVTALADKQFDEFWEIYPRKVGKPQAKKAFKKALEEVTLEEILRCATAYRLARRGEEMKFTKHPATFLNAKPWLDEPDEPYRSHSSHGIEWD